MATRKQAREAIIQILYAIELGNDNAINQAELFLNEQKIRNKQQEFALSLLNGVCENETLLLKIINTFLKTWNVDRLGVIEKNILKLGIYELLKTNTQKAVIINEAIELTKVFNVDDASKLVNGVLDAISKNTLDSILELINSTSDIKNNEMSKSSVTNFDNTNGTTRKRTKKVRSPMVDTKQIAKANKNKIKNANHKNKHTSKQNKGIENKNGDRKI